MSASDLDQPRFRGPSSVRSAFQGGPEREVGYISGFMSIDIFGDSDQPTTDSDHICNSGVRGPRHQGDTKSCSDPNSTAISVPVRFAATLASHLALRTWMSRTMIATLAPTEIRLLPTEQLRPNRFSLATYGDPELEVAADGLLESIRMSGVLVPLVVTEENGHFEIISGHRRFACARKLGLIELPCEVKKIPRGIARRRAVIDYNRQRRKTFSQLMREADALEALLTPQARSRRHSNLRTGTNQTDRRNSDDRRGRTDQTIAQIIGIGGKDLYRQARAVWKAANQGDIRARSNLTQLDDGTKSTHAAYKDLRRRNRLTSDFRPSPYDVWRFRADKAYGTPYPGAIPASIIAHTLYYYSEPGGMIVDPMAGGGSTIDVCDAMGRRCLAYDINPVRPDILYCDVRHGLPANTSGCDLIFCDPPYHTMLASKYAGKSVSNEPFANWLQFLEVLARHCFQRLKPNGYIALLLANQTEKDIPAGYGYLDHVFFGYNALTKAGFLPQRRISCPMDGAYLPQQVTRARTEGRLLGQVRDLLVMSKPKCSNNHFLQSNLGQVEQP